MKNTAFIILILCFCCASIQVVCALEPTENRVYHTQLNESKQVNEQALIFLNNYPNKRLNKKNADNLLLTKKSSILRNSYFTISRGNKKRKLKYKKKTNNLSHFSRKNLSSKKKRSKSIFKTNKFEDKNGDGINDIVANSKL